MQPEEELKRCARCEGWLPRTAFAARFASPDGLQYWCRSCNSEWALEHRPRKRKTSPQVANGQKWCRRCDSIQPLEAFGRHRGLKDGRQTYCRRCTAEIYRARRERSGHLVRPSGIPEGHKFCRTCETVKPLADWSKNASASDGLQTRCKACAKLVGRRDHLQRSYGLSPDHVAFLLRQQQGVCLICLRRPAVHVDHDHETGEVRGMLCFRCNAALGQFDDTPATLRRAARYLVTAGRWESRIEPYFSQRLAEVDVGPAS